MNRFIPRRGRATRSLLLLAIMAGALLLIGSASGTLTGSTFNAGDGNMKIDAGDTHDWADATAHFAASYTGDIPDPNVASGLDDAFTSGQKQDTACPDISGQKSPPKDDFTDAAYASEGTNPVFLYGATFRFAGNGNASENVELNQGTNGKCAGSSLFQRVTGDRLLTIDYTGGGTNAEFNVLTWIDGTDATNSTCFVGNDTPPCWGAVVVALDASEAEGEVNQSAIPSNQNFITSGDVGQFQFAEFGVNLTKALGITGCGKIAGVNIEARASGSSFVSGTKDVIFGTKAIAPCNPTVATVADTGVALSAAGTASLTDTATLSGGTSSAGGTLTFHLYADNGSGGCGTEVTGSPVTKTVSGANGVAYTSPAISVTGAGDYHWRVSYNGDSNNNAIPLTVCGTTANHELSHVNKRTPTVATVADTGGTISAAGTASLTDTATLSDGTTVAGGTLTFHLYADNGSGGCGTEVTGSPVTKAVTNANGTSYTSPAISVTSAGDYHWRVSYNGDSNNNAIALTACGTAADHELSHVNPRSPTLSTSALTPVTLDTAGHALLHDTATLKGGTTNAGGTLTFHLYKDTGTGCDVEQGTGVTKAVSGAGTSANPDTVGVAYTSPDIQVSSAGTYHWRVSYNGDANNNAIPLTACGATGEDAIVNKRSPDLATQLKSGGSNVDHVAVGDSVNDTATLTGATSDAGGTVTYTVYDNSTCTSNANNRDAGTVTVTNGSVPASNSLQMNTSGTFYWRAHYSGDGNNNAADSPCNSEQLAVVALSINKAADSNAVHAGDTIGFTITVTGSGPATNVVLTDDLPAGPTGSGVSWGPSSQTATGDAHPTCSIAPVASHTVTSNGHTYTSTQTLTCTSVASLGSGANSGTAQSFSVHVTSSTSSSVGFTMFNFATATSSNHADVTDNDNTAGDTDNTLVVSALSLDKVADKQLVAAGDPIGFKVTATGSGPAKAVTLTDDLPVGPSGSGVTWSIPAGGVTQPAGQGLTLPTCSITTVASHSVTMFGHTYNSTQHLACTAIDLGGGTDGSTAQSFSVHVTSPTLATSGTFTLFNFGCASSTNATTACDADQTAGDTDNKITVVGQCVLGYPFTSSNSRTSVAFNESGVLRSFKGSATNVQMYYNDEHAMTLGADTNGFTTTPFSAEYAKPGTTTKVAADAGPTAPENPPALSIGDPAAVDPAARPEFPALFVTDITADPTATPANHGALPWNDWQFGGTANAPQDVYGTWKKATIQSGVLKPVSADPTKNDWFLGPNADTANIPTALKDEGYGAEVKWFSQALGLQSGRVYRLQFMVHDGDQNNGGGDVGQACFNAVIP